MPNYDDSSDAIVAFVIAHGQGTYSFNEVKRCLLLAFEDCNYC